MYLWETYPSDSNKRGNFSGALIYIDNLGNFSVILQAVATSFVSPGEILRFSLSKSCNLNSIKCLKWYGAFGGNVEFSS